MTETNRIWWSSVEAAIGVGQKIGSSMQEFNVACDHIVQMIKDSDALLACGSHATAAFLAITVLEETSKVHMGMYRGSIEHAPRKKDPLYRHDQKHLLALGPTVVMGNRLQVAIGEDRMKELVGLAHAGKLVPLRESALYIEQVDGVLKTPKDAISFGTARELLLLAIEAFDDALVGYTNHTFALGEQTDEIFSKWAS
jgi:AbiV family abortive infection protein